MSLVRPSGGRTKSYLRSRNSSTRGSAPASAPDRTGHPRGQPPCRIAQRCTDGIRPRAGSGSPVGRRPTGPGPARGRITRGSPRDLLGRGLPSDAAGPRAVAQPSAMRDLGGDPAEVRTGGRGPGRAARPHERVHGWATGRVSRPIRGRPCRPSPPAPRRTLACRRRRRTPPARLGPADAGAGIAAASTGSFLPPRHTARRPRPARARRVATGNGAGARAGWRIRHRAALRRRCCAPPGPGRPTLARGPRLPPGVAGAWARRPRIVGGDRAR
jgi:hypothetical protein